MSESTAIGMVSESLRNLLIGEMRLASKVTILAPDETGDEQRINLFLYKVQENTTLKNMDWNVKIGDPTKIIPPPLSLNLFYLMTPYAPNDTLTGTGNATAHAILGEAMRVFYENPIVPQKYLVSGLVDAREQIKIIYNTLNLEELSQIWSTFTQPFRLSVLYEVSVVQLDMLPISEKTMAARVRQIGDINVEAPFRPPVVEGIDPVTGNTGTVINFHGRNLSGWKAYVTMMGRLLLNGIELTDDVFSMTVPDDMPPGFHEIRVDISHLFRRLFLFEVTI